MAAFGLCFLNLYLTNERWQQGLVVQSTGTRNLLADEIAKRFSDRRQLVVFACQHARKIFVDSLEYSHEARVELQRSISAYSPHLLPDDCIPDLPLHGAGQAHYYDDNEKFAICLPSKTGSTSWMKFLYALSVDHGQSNPDEISGSVVFRTPEMPRGRDELRAFMANRTGENKLVWRFLE